MEGRGAIVTARLRGVSLGALAARARELVRRVPVALWVVLACAVFLRAALYASYTPAILAFADSGVYVSMAAGNLFADAVRPIGYSLFLKIAHGITAQFAFTIVLQHLLGIASGLLLYGAVRRLGGPVWAAVTAAAAVLLPIDQISVEHTLGSESVFTLLFVAALYAGVRALGDDRPVAGPLRAREGWLIAAGTLLALSAWVRSVAFPLVPFLGLWAAVALGGGWRQRIGHAVLALAPAVALTLTYFAWHESQAGTFGFNRATGWTLYARVAQFADCSQFTPPAGTRRLCESRPPAERPGPDFYSWTEGSPAVRAFGPLPTADDRLREFALAAIEAQPLTYVRTVAGDFLRFFFPTFNPRAYTVGYDLLSVGRRDPPIEEDIRANWVDPYYDGAGPVDLDEPALWLADLQEILRVHPLLLFEALVLALFGIWSGRGRVRWAIVLLGGAATLMLALAALASYNGRYAVPINGPMIAAGALGLWVMIERVRARGGPPGRGDPGDERAPAPPSAAPGA